MSTRTERLAKLKADAASYVADMDAFSVELDASEAAGEPDAPNGDAKAEALNAREDGIYAEARALGVTDHEFMRPVDALASGRGTPNGEAWRGLVSGKIGSKPFTANALIEAVKAHDKTKH